MELVVIRSLDERCTVGSKVTKWKSGSTLVVVGGGLVEGMKCNTMSPSRGRMKGKCRE
jgi:hypothetical protein